MYSFLEKKINDIKVTIKQQQISADEGLGTPFCVIHLLFVQSVSFLQKILYSITKKGGGKNEPFHHILPL